MKTNIYRYLTYLCCPLCKGQLTFDTADLTCKACNRTYPIVDGIPRFIHNTSEDLQLSVQKWDISYLKQLKAQHYEKEFAGYKAMYFEDTFEQLNDVKKIKGSVYLEIGSGLFFMGQLLAKQCTLVIGIDISPGALKVAKTMLLEKNIHNYLLIQGDILNMPLASNSVDLIYGGGVIEHFKNTQQCVNELYRVLRKGGVSFNSVPMLNIGSLTYRQAWGNIPNIPVLRQLAEVVHIRLLGSKHMIFGYEFSFLPSTLRKIHSAAGFKKISIDRFRVKLVFEFIPKILRRALVILANKSPLFWPMLKVVAIK
ncbi:methyltransferase domain-containing protein [Patescibacteria group bacterium]|nr:methyltransferase domain-containing protein [Patescibacteria group bacterium]MBU1472775.1 methyltransferase domain-containing protein [Patescibacteria group bacterium]MBU2460041.1 methyltransferase domain-containing protein [Patescibacteria group bacterium]MBU2544301.1 methyltransferase domain-containing protein [Patescibacteria group bacterium]